MNIAVKEILTIDELVRTIEETGRQPVLLFKHSNSCPISTRALAEFESFLESAGPGLSYGLITVQTSPDVSNHAAALLSVTHETPQVILIRDGRSVWNASHFGISRDSIGRAVADHSMAPSTA